ncbi:MAG: 50S ribosomal protein L18 [Proteobacteria bacterium]|nr:50S ribosomal protein L18 [Pseudomonadota bacterium]
MASKKVERKRIKRKKRVRGKIFGTQERPRLSAFRSSRHIYVQAIADDSGKTLVEASTLSKELKEKLAGLKKAEAAREVGKLVAERLLSENITEVIFDRGMYLYHGRVKALAEAAREAGLKF